MIRLLLSIYISIGAMLTAIVLKSFADDGKTGDLFRYGIGPLIVTVIVAVISWPKLVANVVNRVIKRWKQFKKESENGRS